VLGGIRSRGGICNERPRGNAGRRGVIGLSFRLLSSFERGFCGSRNLGDGERAGGGPASDKDRAFDGEREEEFLLTFGLSSVASISSLSTSSMVGTRLSFNCDLSMFADGEDDSIDGCVRGKAGTIRYYLVVSRSEQSSSGHWEKSCIYPMLLPYH